MKANPFFISICILKYKYMNKSILNSYINFLSDLMAIDPPIVYFHENERYRELLEDYSYEEIVDSYQYACYGSTFN